MANDGVKSRIEMLNWADAETKDALGTPIQRTEAVRVSTVAELQEVIDWARERRRLVQAAAAFTSSGSYKMPPQEWMDAHEKTGLVLMGFDPKPSSEFSHVEVDLDNMRASVGAAVSLEALSHAVNDVSKGQFENRMTITTMHAGAVATLLGSGGVSDEAHSMTSLGLASRWVDGKGQVHNEEYEPGKYFDYSSFDPVTPGQIGKEMTGRGAPFGIGLEATVRLFEAPREVHKVIYGFTKDEEESFLRTIVAFNLAKQALGESGFRPRAFEIMDKSAMNVAKEGMNWAPALPEDTELVIIAEFADFGGDDFSTFLFENGFVPDSVDAERISIVEGKDTKKIDNFRLQGPEHIRAIKKRKFPDASSISTDFAVDAADTDLVMWYGSKIFELRRQLADTSGIGVLYGHGLTRFDPHFRTIIQDPVVFAAHEERLLEIGHEFVRRELALREQGIRKMRERGEKPEQASPKSFDYKVIGSKRSGAHQNSNSKLLKDLDPEGIRLHSAAERWSY